MAYQKKVISWVTVTAGMAASVLSMFLGSLAGTDGTLYGAAIGSCVIGVGGIAFENLIRGVHYAGHKIIREEHQVTLQMRTRVKKAAIMAGVLIAAVALCGVAAFGTMSAIEAITGRTVHSIFGEQQYGNSYGYSTRPPASSSSAPAAPVSPSGSPDTSPSSSPGQSPSVTPAASTAPSASISPSPSASPPDSVSVTPDSSPS